MRSIRRRLTRELLLVALVLLGGGWVAFFLAARTELIEQFDDTLGARALTLTTLTVLDQGHLRLEAADRLARNFSLARPRDFFEIWDAGGKPLLRSDSLGGAELLPPPASGDRRVFWNLELPHGHRGRALALYFQPRLGEEDPKGVPEGGEVRLAVASTREGLDEALTELLAIAAAGGVVLFLAIWWGVPRILRRGLQPLDDLAEQVSGIRRPPERPAGAPGVLV